MPKKALVVDNDFFFVEFIAALLEKMGYEVIKAYDGKEGILRLEEGPVDILFVDTIMPKIDGAQFIKIVRQKFSKTPFPIIAVSGILLEEMDEPLSMEVDYCMVKGPIEQMAPHIDELIVRIGNQDPLSPETLDCFEPGNLYPRQITSELIEIINFQKAVYESIGVGVMVIDKDARVIEGNLHALTILNRPLEDLLARPVASMFPKKERAGLIEAMRSLISDQGLKRITLAMPVESREIRLTISLLRIRGDVGGWVITLHDLD